MKTRIATLISIVLVSVFVTTVVLAACFAFRTSGKPQTALEHGLMLLNGLPQWDVDLVRSRSRQMEYQRVACEFSRLKSRDVVDILHTFIGQSRSSLDLTTRNRKIFLLNRYLFRLPDGNTPSVPGFAYRDPDPRSQGKYFVQWPIKVEGLELRVIAEPPVEMGPPAEVVDEYMFFSKTFALRRNIELTATQGQ